MKRNRNSRIGAALLGLAVAFAFSAAPAHAGELDDLKKQVQTLMKRIEQLEAKEKKMEAAQKALAESQKKALAVGDVPGSWKMPGSNTSVSFSGYVKFDAIYDFNKDLGDSFIGYDSGGSPSAIPLEGEEDDRQKASFHARQSRIRFDSLTKTDAGDLKTRIEGDFFYHGGKPYRLRHAYGSLGPVLAGQTWSIFMDEDTYADTVDFEGPVGVISSRLAQLRYTWSMGKTLTGQVAIEDPGGPTILSAGVSDPKIVAKDGQPIVEEGEPITVKSSSQDRLPTLTAALRFRPSWGALNVSGMLGEVRYNHQASKTEDNLTISGLHLGGHLNLGDSTKLLGTFNVGKGGLGNYMVGAGTAATLDANGELSAVDSMGGFFGLTHKWTANVGSGLYYGWVENDYDESAKTTFASKLSEELRTLHVNFWWTPASKVRVGLELIKGWRETNGGEEGDATRAQMGIQYSF